jgi:hypothetical protein
MWAFGRWYTQLLGRLIRWRIPATSADQPPGFRDWDMSGTVRVLFAHWVERGDRDEFALVSEARVQPVDLRAERRLRVLWALVGPFESRAGAEALKAVVRRAENGASHSVDGPVRDRPAARPSR